MSIWVDLTRTVLTLYTFGEGRGAASVGRGSCEVHGSVSVVDEGVFCWNATEHGSVILR